MHPLFISYATLLFIFYDFIIGIIIASLYRPAHSCFRLLKPEDFGTTGTNPYWITHLSIIHTDWSQQPSQSIRVEDYRLIHSSVICQTTGPQPLPKRFLHLMRSRASSFKWEYPLLSSRSSSNFLRLLPRLLVTSICPCIFPSITFLEGSFYVKCGQSN
jgi:hypothetical protein